MMPQAIDAAIKEMCGDAMTQAVAALADKYGFDVDDANRFLDTSALKLVRKRGPSPKTSPEPSPRGKAKAKSEDKPKRGKTGYLLYADEVRAEVKASLTAELEEGEKLKPQDTVRAIAARWKEEDQEVRDEWNTKSKTPATSDDEAVEAVAEQVPELVVVPVMVPVVEVPKSKKESKKESKKSAKSKKEILAPAKLESEDEDD